eukprot:gene8095-16610_t
MGEISTSKSKLESLLRSKDIDWTEVIELLNEFPDLISLRIKENKLVLHLAADGDCPLKIFKELISLYPSGLKAPDKYTKLPIHYAVRNERGSKDIIEAILYSCPECAQIPNKDGTLALHYAAAFQSDVMIINMLISAFPKGSESRDNAGKIPLMYATEKKAPISIITSLLEANSDGVSFADKDGRIPLHYAVFKRESLAEDTKIEARYRGNAKWIPGKIVRARLEGTYDIQYDAKEKDSEKQVKREHIRIPFDLTIKSPNTCSNSDSCSHILDSPDNTSDYSNHMLEIVELLYNHKPEIIKIFDDNDRLPLHYAVMYNAPIAVVKALVSYYPNSVNLKDYEGNLPIQYAYSNQCDIVSYLLPKCYNTGFAWIWTLTQTNPEDKYLKQVEYILDNTSSSTQDKDNDEVEDDEDEDEEEDYESHIEKLSKLLDSKGCNAVDVATGISTSKGKPKIKSPLGATAAITEAGGMSADTLITATTTIAITPEDVAYDSVHDVLEAILACQGGKIEGNGHVSMIAVADTIASMILITSDNSSLIAHNDNDYNNKQQYNSEEVAIIANENPMGKDEVLSATGGVRGAVAALRAQLEEKEKQIRELKNNAPSGHGLITTMLTVLTTEKRIGCLEESPRSQQMSYGQVLNTTLISAIKDAQDRRVIMGKIP